jgi:class 3 adenylate cyclase
MQQIADWLDKLGMSEYAQRFAENRIDFSVLPDLTDQHLKDLGIALGDRLKMLRAIRDLGNASVAVTAPSAPAAAEPTRKDDAERRQLTVMFCDLVGSTALSAKLDPEDLRTVIGAYHRCCTELVERNGGFVAKFMGDGILAYFGYPQAHEHDAKRAVRAGLAVVEAVPKLETAGGVPLQVRVGIATGLVVVGDLVGSGAAQEQAVVGETPNLAARLQALAEPGVVVIGSSTRRLTGGLFEYRDLGTVALKGFAENVPAWQVLGEGAAESRFEALRATTTPLTPALRVLVVITFRPEFTPPWLGLPQVTLLSLNRLPPRRGAEMIARLTGGKALPKEIADQIIDRTDGVPLFIEELTKAVVESGVLTDAGDRYTVAGALPPLAIPATLNASLLARLDRLAPVREVAQIGAALGRQFSHELISAVAPMPQQQLDDALAQLVSAELIFRRGSPPDAEYAFKHALVQDAAYSTLLRSRRQQLHVRIAATLEDYFPEIVVAQPALLAQHCAEAGLAEKAVVYWLKAGRQALARSAMTEAVAQLQKGLDVLVFRSHQRIPKSA